MKKFQTQLILLVAILCLVSSCHSIQQELERKISAVSFEYSTQDGFIFKQPIQTKLYQSVDPSNNPIVSEIDGVCDPPNTSTNSLLQLFTSPFAYYFRMKDYSTFFGPVLSHKEVCTVRVKMGISQLPANIDNAEYDSSFLEGLRVISDSNSVSNFQSIFGPFIATNIQYGNSELTSFYKSLPVGIYQTPILSSESLIPFKQVKNSNVWFSNGNIVNFTISTLSNFVKVNNLAPSNVIASIQKLETDSFIDPLQIQSLYQSSYSTNFPICENSRIFNLIEANLDSGFMTYVITYAYQMYGVTIGQIRNGFESKGIFSNVKLTSIAGLSLDRNHITGIPIFKVNRAASSSIRESYLTMDESEAKSISSDYSILGYCSSVSTHPDMIPLYRFNFDRHYYRTSEKGESGWIIEGLMCYVYSHIVSIPSAQICIVN
ncbi:predicted protein [Naegleria gruberi]|uniref:Predicted protein n=1 Tax=Naegleria gruberi TaxID=5762 RepID=D2VCJ7_NAEGR|nr:uncharacterized protein NAEGRDRAFT_79439 [Naegleria gruberi]EFC45325.1 predicted protein [Naegleria gruberi]|eukprot:XP_002678069.1 predicted protein [Naegleria gruberi strain NEG-M]